MDFEPCCSTNVHATLPFWFEWQLVQQARKGFSTTYAFRRHARIVCVRTHAKAKPCGVIIINIYTHNTLRVLRSSWLISDDPVLCFLFFWGVWMLFSTHFKRVHACSNALILEPSYSTPHTPHSPRPLCHLAYSLLLSLPLSLFQRCQNNTL